LHDDKIVLDRFARGIIRRKVRLLIGRGGFTRQDRDDLEQQLVLRLLQSLDLFDPELAGPNVFIATVIERAVALILRERRAKGDAKANGATKPPEPAWDASRFAMAFVGETPATILAIIERAKDAGLSERKATRLLKQAERNGLVYRWRFGATRPVQLATIPQPESPE